MMTTAEAQSLDPVLMAVLAKRLDAIVGEMTNTLFRTGRSAVLNTAKDFSCSIVSAKNELLTAYESIHVHVFGGGLQTVWMHRLHDDVRAGDAFLHNDPYMGNTHTADHTILVPVIVDDVHLFTVCAKAHQADCGNSLPTTYAPFARDLYEEGGLNFPCVRVQREYQDVEDIIRICRRRIRVPDVWYGDYLASMGAARIGERRLTQLVAEHGRELIEAFVREWLDYSERVMIKAIEQLPAGELVGRGTHDALPGLEDGIPLTVRVKVKPDEGRVDVDLRDNPDCVPAGVNLSEACSTAAALIGVYNCLKQEVPRNAGSFRRVNVQLRENCVAGIPRFPASCSMATTNVMNRIINATQAAMAQAAPGHGLAEGGVAMGVGYGVVSGHDGRRGGKPYVNQLIMGSNGGPASSSADGWISYNMPGGAMSIYFDSVEVIESHYPILVKRNRLLTDSGGAGRFRGGPATEVMLGPRREPVTIVYFADGNDNPPRGVRGGQAGLKASVTKVVADGSEQSLPTIGQDTLLPGEWIVGNENGGGGYGSPLERDPELVLQDVREGWVSSSQARSDYGVVLESSEAGAVLAVDEEATDAARKAASAPPDG